jgi:hypothetical protein
MVKLEDGKSYVNEIGAIIGPLTEVSEGDLYWYHDSKTNTNYWRDGMIANIPLNGNFVRPTKRDLVKEAPEINANGSNVFKLNGFSFAITDLPVCMNAENESKKVKQGSIYIRNDGYITGEMIKLENQDNFIDSRNLSVYYNNDGILLSTDEENINALPELYLTHELILKAVTDKLPTSALFGSLSSNGLVLNELTNVRVSIASLLNDLHLNNGDILLSERIKRMAKIVLNFRDELYEINETLTDFNIYPNISHITAVATRVYNFISTNKLLVDEYHEVSNYLSNKCVPVHINENNTQEMTLLERVKLYRNKFRERLNELKFQSELMKFDPTNGEPKPYPSNAAQYRKYHGASAWLFNPWTGEKRHPSNIGSDIFGLLISHD